MKGGKGDAGSDAAVQGSENVQCSLNPLMGVGLRIFPFLIYMFSFTAHQPSVFSNISPGHVYNEGNGFKQKHILINRHIKLIDYNLSFYRLLLLFITDYSCNSGYFLYLPHNSAPQCEKTRAAIMAASVYPLKRCASR